MVHAPFTRLHFCRPAVAWLWASATFPLTAGVTNVPAPSSQTYNVLASANQIPNGNAVPVLAVVLGKPGRIVIGTVASCAAVPAGRVPALPTWYTVLIPLPPLPLVMYSVLLKIVMPRKFVSFPGLSLP